MSAHQVITGALNQGEHVFSVCSVDGISFTVCAVGANIVILGANFERVQVIPGIGKDDCHIVSSVSTCQDTGKIAATYGNVIRIFEPSHHKTEKPRNLLDYKWFETHSLRVKGPVSSVIWNYEGQRLLVAIRNELLLYQQRCNLQNHASEAPVTFTIQEDQHVAADDWQKLWSRALKAPPKFIRYSPDGFFFATCGDEESIVKIWYEILDEATNTVSFSFYPLYHPNPITGFEWRRVGRYMPRKCVSNVLITWCSDNTSRIWKETPSTESLMFELNNETENVAPHANEKKGHGKFKHNVKRARNKILRKFHHIREKNDAATKAESQISRISSVSDFSQQAQTSQPGHIQFHLCASINAETDCLLVPTMEGVNTLRKTFAVHWMNNKEIVYSQGAEKFFAEMLFADFRDMKSTSPVPPSQELSEVTNTPDLLSPEFGQNFSSKPPSVHHEESDSMTGSQTKDRLDANLERMLRQWAKSNDILFAVHPVDGSLLTWTIEWLDDPRRQPSVSFSSRFPGTFPITDAASLRTTLHTFNPYTPVYFDVLHKCHNDAEANAHLLERYQSHSIYMLTNHSNGTLNLWQLTMDENSQYTTVLNIMHISRMCGHRFQINEILPHPVLPLVITTSHFTATEHIGENERKDSLSEAILWKISSVGPLCRSGGVSELAKVAAHSAFSFQHIAWVPAILPSSTLGTVCNSPSSCFIATNGTDLVLYQAVVDARSLLAEIYNAKKTKEDDDEKAKSTSMLLPNGTAPDTNMSDAFKIVSTQSAAKPGCVIEIGKLQKALPTGKILFFHVYNERLVIEDNDRDVDEPLANISLINDRTRAPSFSDRYFIVVVVKEASVDRLLMFALNLASQQATPIPILDSENLPDNKGFLRPASPVPPSVASLHTEFTKICDQPIVLANETRIIAAVPAAGHLSSSSLYPACKAPYVLMTACDDDMIRFWKCTQPDPTKGIHEFRWKEWRMISDSSPSLLEIDGPVYALAAAHSGRLACAYDSRTSSYGAHDRPTKIDIGIFECESSGGVEWMREDLITIDHIDFPQVRPPNVDDYSSTARGMREQAAQGWAAMHPALIASGSLSSRASLTRPRSGLFEMLHASASRTGLNQHHLHHGPHEEHLLDGLLAQSTASHVHVPQYDTIKRVLSTSTLKAQETFDNLPISDMIRIDWVSTEDGGHILTVAVASKIYLYTQVSQDQAQKNVVAMRDTEVSIRRPSLRKSSSLAAPEHMQNKLTRWVCTRIFDLNSADGLPPLPTSLQWARDGILIVGMQTEMRCYNQWNLKPKQAPKAVAPLPVNAKRKGTGTSTLGISPSHSMLDQLGKKTKDHDRMRTKLLIEAAKHSHTAAPIPDLEPSEEQNLVEAFSGFGLFEFARNASPILPQYHPKQLLVLLNAGRTRRVKAILLHVLNNAKPTNHWQELHQSGGCLQSIMTAALGLSMDEAADYDEIDDISPLPLYALLAADDLDDNDDVKEKAEGLHEELFTDEVEENLDDLLNQDDHEGRERLSSTGSEMGSQRDGPPPAIIFSTKHNRALTELLTHTHLPGLSSVDQMHLLAIADTLSHFNPDAIDKLTQANASMKPAVQSVLGEHAEAGGYAAAAGGIDTVDECGLRFLMSMKQHEYLLLCLPMKQKQQLRVRGLSSAHVIWAQHSETETELLNAIPCLQKSNPTWEELKGLGIAWWLKNTASLKVCVEKLAAAAYKQNQDPMDAALYWLAMRKKNMLTILFKNARDTRMSGFFMSDFSDPFHRKTAEKNAFVLMSKQRFMQAAALFLLAERLVDALKVLIDKLHDIQLAMIVLRLYEQDPDKQQAHLKEILCKEILGQTVEEFEEARGDVDEDTVLSRDASKDPFIRSMAYWLLRDYAKAAHTLVEEASSDRLDSNSDGRHEQFTLSNIFNFYTYLRLHPLVVRQKLTDAGSQIGSTEKFLAVARQMELMLTPAERRLFFRTSAEHMAHGCPMLALDVLSRLPKHIHISMPGNESIRAILNSEGASASGASEKQPAETVANVDWSQPANVVAKDELELDWGDDDDDEEDEETAVVAPAAEPTPTVVEDKVTNGPVVVLPEGPLDIIAQQLRFIASLRILTEELSTLAGGFVVDGGQLRFQLFAWLEKEVEVLKTLCDYQTAEAGIEIDGIDETYDSSSRSHSPLPMHEALKNDRTEYNNRLQLGIRRRKWLGSNQKLLRSFTSFCQLQMAQNHRLTSALMELLLLLLEIQADNGPCKINDSNAFPLLVSTVSPQRMFVASPLAFIETQCHDLLSSISNLSDVPQLKESSLSKYSKLYGISLGLSSCLYQSLSDADYANSHILRQYSGATSGILTRRTRHLSVSDDVRVSTSPARWPGVDTLVALLGRERDDEAPNLRLLLVECFISIIMSLFTYSMASYDARWLYRLSSHSIGPKEFAAIFGGGGEKRMKAVPPARPPRPSRPSSGSVSSDTATAEQTSLDSNTLRAKLHAKVFGADAQGTSNRPAVTPIIEHTLLKWVPPNRNIVQLLSEKSANEMGVDYDSDTDSEADAHDDEDRDDEGFCTAADPDSYSWAIIRLAVVEQMIARLKQFLVLSGFDPTEIASVAPRIASTLQVLCNWSVELSQELRMRADVTPEMILPDPQLVGSENDTSLAKYRSILEAESNTPFESEDQRVLPVKRLWSYLVRQENLVGIFIRHIFKKDDAHSQKDRNDATMQETESLQVQQAHPYKIIHKENEPIVAFAVNRDKPGWLVVSTGRELQEMDISKLLDDASAPVSWLNSRTELDVEFSNIRKDTLKDNDDYQLFNSGNTRGSAPNMTLSPFIIDRSRLGLRKLFKRTISGIRRMDGHPGAPFYLTGASDGSIRMWEWGVGQPVYTARVAGQHAKVAKIHFSSNGSKFAAVDGDGMLCLWQTGQTAEQKKPFFNVKAHSKSAADVRFLGQSSSQLLTAGAGAGDLNLCLWDTLMPTSKACVQNWSCHPEGATCAIYLPASYSIISGGRNGEIAVWDIRAHSQRSSQKLFDSNQAVKTIISDPNNDILVVGSSDGDIKLLNTDYSPQVLQHFAGEHVAKTGFSFRQVGANSVQGVQQLYMDSSMRLFSCGADNSLKIRSLTFPRNYHQY
ncbi:unnamed protein product, partial [Mesorhabditis spiculigera]